VGLGLDWLVSWAVATMSQNKVRRRFGFNVMRL